LILQRSLSRNVKEQSALESLDIFACPLTGEPLRFDRSAGTIGGARARYAIESNVLCLNPQLQNPDLRNYYQAVNGSKPPVAGDFFDGPFDPVETYYRRSKKSALVDLLPPNLGVALDVGGGSGEILRSLVGHAGSRFRAIVVVDWASSAMLGPAQSLAHDPRHVFVEADATRLPIRDRSVDFIFNSEMIEHLLPAQSESLLAEFARVLKPGGRVLLTTPNGLEYRRLLQESVLSAMLLLTGRKPSDLPARERLKASLFRPYLQVTGHHFTDLEAAEKTGQIGHFNVLKPRRLTRQAQGQGLAVRRSLMRIFVPIVVPRGLQNGTHDPLVLDRLERLIQRLRLDRLLLSCQMHVLEKPP
jgi:ubiquinone/menaquinone biosynthesis C-methylase UbiE